MTFLFIDIVLCSQKSDENANDFRFIGANADDDSLIIRDSKIFFLPLCKRRVSQVHFCIERIVVLSKEFILSAAAGGSLANDRHPHRKAPADTKRIHQELERCRDQFRLIKRALNLHTLPSRRQLKKESECKCTYTCFNALVWDKKNSHWLVCALCAV
jgi:hypothetical protein